MPQPVASFNIVKDDLSRFAGHGPAFVAFGEVMVREMPADHERLERTRHVYISMAGSELTLAVMLSRLGIPGSFITRVPANPYGWMLRNLAREQGLNTEHFVWAERTELMGRFLMDRLGGGDTWNGGFYYGLLTEDDKALAIQKGVLVGDAATRLKQTLMYDLPIITREEVQSLLRADVAGGGKRTTR